MKNALAGRLIVGGLLGAVIAAAAGRALELSRFGSTDDEALARVETEFRSQFDGSAEALGAMAARVIASRTAIQLAQRDAAGGRAAAACRAGRRSGRAGGGAGGGGRGAGGRGGGGVAGGGASLFYG